MTIRLNNTLRTGLVLAGAYPRYLESYALPGSFHPDPADRLLVATARVHGLTLLTADKRILRYSKVRSMDARK